MTFLGGIAGKNALAAETCARLDESLERVIPVGLPRTGEAATERSGERCVVAAVSPQGRASDVVADDAVSSLFERHADRVFGYCLKWLRSREDAEDAVQTTFLYALRGVRRGIVPELESAWLLAIARNVCLSRSQTAARRRSRELAHDPQLLQDVVAAPEAGEETLDSLAEALTALTEPQRRALLMREWRGLGYDEIAAELGVSRSAVETLLFRARRAVSSRLRPVASLAPLLRSFGAGGAGKVAAGAACAVVTAAVGSAVVTQSHGHRPTGAARAPAVAAAQAVQLSTARPAASERRSSATHSRRAPARPRQVDVPRAPVAAPAAAAGASRTASQLPVAPPQGRAPEETGATAPAATPSTPTAAGAPTTTATTTSATTTTVATVTGPATTAVATTTAAAANVVGQTAATAVAATTSVVSTAAGTVDAATAAVAPATDSATATVEGTVDTAAAAVGAVASAVQPVTTTSLPRLTLP